jgi:hypothetical protein
VKPSDRIKVMGSVYRVEGEPAWWPTGMVVTLKGVDDGT